LPVVERIYPQSNKFATGVESKGTGNYKLNDSPAWSADLMLKTCILQTPRLVAQREFMSALIAVGKRLTSLPTKDLKSKL